MGTHGLVRTAAGSPDTVCVPHKRWHRHARLLSAYDDALGKKGLMNIIELMAKTRAMAWAYRHSHAIHPRYFTSTLGIVGVDCIV